MKRTYSHIDMDERRKIARWRMAGLTVDIIAEKLGRHRSTIFREIKRNMFIDEVIPDLNGYFGCDGWMKHNAGMGIRMLLNQHAVIERGGDKNVVASLTDLTAFGANLPRPDLDKALNGAPTGVPIILMEHQPRLAKRSATKGVALQLSGHTHGGMVRGLDLLVALANDGYVSGLCQVGDMQLTSTMAPRFGQASRFASGGHPS